MTMAISKAAEDGAKVVVCASTGNTSASAAAYAARAGMIARGHHPRRPRRARQARAGADPRREGRVDPRQLRRRAARRARARGARRRHGRELDQPVPHRGQKTAAFEICDALGEAPDVHCIPVGNAGNITAYWKGYAEYAARRRRREARRACSAGRPPASAPLVHGEPVPHPETIATAIRIGNPASWDGAIAARDESGGAIGAVTDAQILDAYRLLASLEGVFVEPASAASVAGLLQAAARRSDRARRDSRVHGHRPRLEGPEPRDRRDRGAARRRRDDRRWCSRSWDCERARGPYGRAHASTTPSRTTADDEDALDCAVAALGIVLAAALTTAAVTSGGRSRAATTTRRLLRAAPTTTAGDDRRRRRPRTKPTTTMLAHARSRRRPIPYATAPIIQIGVDRDPEDRLAAPDLRRHHAHGDRPRTRSLARLGAAVPARQHGVPRAPGDAHASVPESRPARRPATRSSSTCPVSDCVYKVTGTQIVYPTDLCVIDPTPTPTITLIACHPKHSAAQRIVVKGKLVATSRIKRMTCSGTKLTDRTRHRRIRRESASSSRASSRERGPRSRARRARSRSARSAREGARGRVRRARRGARRRPHRCRRSSPRSKRAPRDGRRAREQRGLRHRSARFTRSTSTPRSREIQLNVRRARPAHARGGRRRWSQRGQRRHPQRVVARRLPARADERDLRRDEGVRHVVHARPCTRS